MLDLEADDGKRSEPNIDTNITSALLNKIMKSIEDIYDTYIKSKYTKIVKHKAMIPKVQKLEVIHADFWGPHNPPSILGKSYISLLLNKYTQNSWVLLLRSKDKFFDVFKQ